MNRRRFLTLGAAVGGAGLLTASYPVFIERYLILINRYRITVPRLPAAFEGFTIVHLTDIHFGFLMPLFIIEDVVRRTNSLRKDMVLCTGDFIHERNSRKQIDTVWPSLLKLKAPDGVYSVLGNHDHWADTDRSLCWMERSGHGIRHRARQITRNGKSLWVAGAGDLWEDHLALDTLISSVPEDDCTIIAAHNPDSADADHTKQVDLFVCGHTHGGQVRVPRYGPPVLPVRNKEYTSGLRHSQSGTPVFISRGIGWTIYPVRFNCTPEIAVLELTRGYGATPGKK